MVSDVIVHGMPWIEYVDVVATGQGVHGLALAPPDKSRVVHS